MMREPSSALRWIKTIHTVVWAIFAGSILAIPVLAWFEQWLIVTVLIGLVLAECLVLALNKMQCPLTPLAARYTDDDRENFDIYLPLWLAKNNKLIFGFLFVAGILFTLAQWIS